ncbi:hypothetical protein IAT38_001843 [Cryptococcus sp. DSM 104549]
MPPRRQFDTSLSSSAKGKGKGKGNGKNQASAASAPATISPPDPAHAMTHVPTHTAEERAELDKNSKPEAAPSPEEVEEDSCFICAEPIAFYSVGVCGHKTCHVCAIRLRTFYKKKECTFCKTPTPSLLFSRSPDATFPTEHLFNPSPLSVIAHAKENAVKDEPWDQGLILPGTLDIEEFPYGDESQGVVFEDEDMMEATLALLRFNCPYPDCAFQATSWITLERHTVATHGLAMCTLCRTQLSRFAHEMVLYPPHLLPLHDPSKLKRGQRPPKPRTEEEIELVKTWDAPHPICDFCHLAFFGPEDLFKHMRTDHEECHVCRELGDKNVYFGNYVELERHWREQHYPCTMPQCLEDKFIVFGSELDLRAHMMERHSKDMSARDRAQIRQLNIDFSSSSSAPAQSTASRGFSLGRPAPQPATANSASGSRGPSRMRDTPPHQQVFQPAPMTAAQEAQARRIAQIDQQESNQASQARRRAFQTGLSRPEGEGGAGGSGGGAAAAGGSASGFSTPREDVDDATATRHAELLSRVAMLTGDSTTKLSSFRSAVRQFKTNESSARDMVDTLFNVLDRELEPTTGIVREIASLFVGEGEKDKLTATLEALNALRIEQRDQFPSLGSAPTGLGSNYAGIANGTVLNAKRSTRGAGRHVWDNVAAAANSQPAAKPAQQRYVPGSGMPAASSSSAFPSLGGSSSASGSGSGGRGSGTHSTPWATGGAGSTSRQPSALTGPIIRSVHAPTIGSSSSSRKPKPLTESAFPSLPASSSSRGVSAKERAALLSKPTPREESIRRIKGVSGSTTPVNGWGAESTAAGLDALSLENDQGVGSSSGAGQQEGGQTGGGKKKGKGKQLLFSVSARP